VLLIFVLHFRSVIIVTRLWAGWLGFNSWWEFFLFTITSRPALGATSYPTGTRGSFLGSKVSRAWSWPLLRLIILGAIPLLPNMSSWCGA